MTVESRRTTRCKIIPLSDAREPQSSPRLGSMSPTPSVGITSDDVRFIANVVVALSLLFFFLNRALLPRVAPKYMRRDCFLLAFELTCLVPLTYCAVVGHRLWTRSLDRGFETPYKRLHALVAQEPREMILVNCGFQIWDFLISFGHPKLCSTEMLLHHSLAAALALTGLHMGFAQYYGAFFLGVTEISSVQLVIVDVGKYYPEFARKHPMVDLFFKFIFLLTFIAVRDVMFVKYSIQLFKDSFAVLQAGTSSVPYMIKGFLVTNVFFNVLQITWTKLLLDGVIETLRGKKDDKIKEN